MAQHILSASQFLFKRYSEKLSWLVGAKSLAFAPGVALELTPADWAEVAILICARFVVSFSPKVRSDAFDIPVWRLREPANDKTSCPVLSPAQWETLLDIVSSLCAGHLEPNSGQDTFRDMCSTVFTYCRHMDVGEPLESPFHRYSHLFTLGSIAPDEAPA